MDTWLERPGLAITMGKSSQHLSVLRVLHHGLADRIFAQGYCTENVHIVLVEYNWSGREFLLATMQHVFRVL